MKSWINEKGLADHQPETIELFVKITGAKTASVIPTLGTPGAIIGFDAGDFTQAASDALIGTGDIAAVTTSFGSTRMGTDTMGFILNCNGQVRKLVAMQAFIHGDAGATVNSVQGVQGTTTALTDANTIACCITTLGNLYGSIILSNLDSVTNGFVRLVFHVKTK